MVDIRIDPVNAEVALVENLVEKLSSIFTFEVEIRRRLNLSDIISFYDEDREQVRADLLLEDLLNRFPTDTYSLILVDADAYVSGLNFVFGVARPGWGALVFLSRLKQGVYGGTAPQALFELRVLKETLHELGHVLGLGHCRTPRCVMSFSNSLIDVDRKAPAYCVRCLNRLAPYIRLH